MTDAEPTTDKAGLTLQPAEPQIYRECDNPSAAVAEKSSSGTDAENGHVDQTQASSEIDVPPDGGYGWVCVACIFMINAHTWGINSVGGPVLVDTRKAIANGSVQSYGIFLSYYLSHPGIYPGASALQYAFVGGLSIAMSQAVAPVATFLIRRWGTVAPLWLGIVMQLAALLGASFTTEVWQLFLSQGLCFGFGMGFIFNATVGIIPQWFDKRRSFANSIGTAGSGIGGLIYSLATDAMIRNLGLGWAFRILAIVSCSVCAVCALLLKDRNKAVGSVHNAFDFRLLKRTHFVLVLGWGCFSMIGYIGLIFSLPNYAISIGLTPEQASIVGAMLNLGQGVGRPLIGYFSDTFGRINVSLLGTFSCGILCFAIWIPATNYGVLILFALIGGAVAGTIWTTVAPVTAEVVGLQILPSALSLFWVALIIPSTFAEVIALELKQDHSPIYLHMQIFTGMMYVGASLCLWFVRAWKVHELENAGVQDPEKREMEIQDDDTVLRPVEISRTISVAQSVRTAAKASKGLWLWTKV